MIVHGQWAVVVVGGGCERLMMVVGGGGVVLWSFVADGDVAPGSRVNKGKRERRGLPEFMWTVTTICVVTVWTTWHVC